MRTDVDTCLKDIADWYVKNRRGMTEPELEAILNKHVESKAEAEKFVSFLETEPGQLRFKTLLRERKELPKPSTLKEEGWVYVKVGTTEVRGRKVPDGMDIEQVSPTFNRDDFDKAVRIIEEKLAVYPHLYDIPTKTGSNPKEPPQGKLVQRSYRTPVGIVVDFGIQIGDTVYEPRASAVSPIGVSEAKKGWREVTTQERENYRGWEKRPGKFGNRARAIDDIEKRWEQIIAKGKTSQEHEKEQLASYESYMKRRAEAERQYSLKSSDLIVGMALEEIATGNRYVITEITDEGWVYARPENEPTQSGGSIGKGEVKGYRLAIQKAESIPKAGAVTPEVTPIMKFGIDVTKATEEEYIKAGLDFYVRQTKELRVGIPLNTKAQTKILREEFGRLAIPKTKVTSLGFLELELPVARAVEALVNENPWSSGFHGALNQRWTIVFRGKVGDRAVNAAKVAGLEISYREAPVGSGQILTDISLPSVGVSEIEKATAIFNRFAELYEGSIVGKYEYKKQSQAEEAKSYAEGLGYRASLQHRGDVWELTVEKPQSSSNPEYGFKEQAQPPIIHEATSENPDPTQFMPIEVTSAFPEGEPSHLTAAEKAQIDRLIEAVPDENDTLAINYWLTMGDKEVYLEGWIDQCLSGTGFPPMEDGDWDEKIQYMVRDTRRTLLRKQEEKERPPTIGLGLFKLIEGGFREFEAGSKEWLYGVTWGVYKKA